MELIVSIAQIVLDVLRFCLVLSICLMVWVAILPYYAHFRRGYFVRSFLGRESDDDWSIEYAEEGRSLMFFGPGDNYILKIPSERLWDEIMPGWAKTRKKEIVERIEKDVNNTRHKKFKFVFREYDDRQNAQAILGSGQNVSGDNKVFYVIKDRGGGVADKNQLQANKAL